MECRDIRDVEKTEDMHIHVFDNFITEDNCNKLLWAFFNALPPFDATSDDDGQYRGKKRSYQEFKCHCPHSPAHNLIKWVRNSIRRKVQGLYPEEKFSHHLTNMSEIMNDCMDYHSDNDMRDKCGAMAEYGSTHHGYGVRPRAFGEGDENWAPHDGEWIPNHTPTRFCTCILYLNDNFKGGETHFPHFDVQCTPKTGTLLVFKSDWPQEHGVRPVEGARYNLAAWFASESRNKEYEGTKYFNSREET